MADFARIPEVRAILDQPETITLSHESFDVLVPGLPSILDKWRGDIEHQLDIGFRKHFPDLPSGVQVRSLAAGHLIRCKDCKAIFPITNISAPLHHCHLGDFGGDYKYRRSARRPTERDRLSCALTSSGFIQWHPVDFELLYIVGQEVVEACKQDRLCTLDTMDKLDPRLPCPKEWLTSDCDESLSWREAVRYIPFLMLI